MSPRVWLKCLALPAATMVGLVLLIVALYQIPVVQNWTHRVLIPELRMYAKSWDGPSTVYTTPSGVDITVQYEAGDETGRDAVLKELPRSVNAVELFAPFTEPVVVRIYRDPLALRFLSTDFLMQPVGRALPGFVFLVSPETRQAKAAGIADVPEHVSQRITRDTLTHELAHVLYFQESGGSGGLRVLNDTPTWFIEGFAEMASGSSAGKTPSIIEDESWTDPMDVVDEWYVFYTVDPTTAYRASAALMDELERLRGSEGTMRVIRGLREKPFRVAFQDVYGFPHTDMERRWGLLLFDEERKLRTVQRLERHACPEDVPGLCISRFEKMMAKSPLRQEPLYSTIVISNEDLGFFADNEGYPWQWEPSDEDLP